MTDKIFDKAENTQTDKAYADPVQRAVILGGIRSKAVGSGNWINDMVGDNCVAKTCKCGRIYYGLKRRKTCFYCAV